MELFLAFLALLLLLVALGFLAALLLLFLGQFLAPLPLLLLLFIVGTTIVTGREALFSTGTLVVGAAFVSAATPTPSREDAANPHPRRELAAASWSPSGGITCLARLV